MYERLKEYMSVTNVFLAIQIVLFLIMTVSGGSTNPMTLLFFGAKFNPYIIQGQFYRFVTPIFLHIGFEHLLMNGISQFFLGNTLENYIGRWRFVLLFLLSGVMGNAFSFAFNSSISAGASTAIFGMFAAYIVLGRLYPSNPYLSRMSQTYKILIALMLFQGLFTPSVDWWGHLGGALGGILVTLAMPLKDSRYITKKQQVGAGFLYLVLIIMTIFIGFIRW